MRYFTFVAFSGDTRTQGPRIPYFTRAKRSICRTDALLVIEKNQKSEPSGFPPRYWPKTNTAAQSSCEHGLAIFLHRWSSAYEPRLDNRIRQVSIHVKTGGRSLQADPVNVPRRHMIMDTLLIQMKGICFFGRISTWHRVASSRQKPYTYAMNYQHWVA